MAELHEDRAIRCQLPVMCSLRNFPITQFIIQGECVPESPSHDTYHGFKGMRQIMYEQTLSSDESSFESNLSVQELS